MQNLIQDIKNKTFHPVYLLYGEEAYLRKQYRDKLVNALVSSDDTMNYNSYEGKEINIPEIIDLAETLPFFADKRVIVIENSNLFKSGGEQLANYLSSPAETVVFIFVETQIDKRSKLFKVVKNQGRITEFTTQNEATLKLWVATLLKKENKIIREDVCEYFLERTGNDMSTIRTELEKLVCYCINDYEVTREAVSQITTQNISIRIFDIVTAIADKKQKAAIDMYHELLSLKEPPMVILALIARQYNIMLEIKELQGKGCSRKNISDKIGLSPYITGKYEKQTPHYTLQQLMTAIKKCVYTDEQIKTGKMKDDLGVELLIVELSNK